MKEIMGCNDTWTHGQNLFTLRRMFGKSELRNVLSQLKKLSVTVNRNNWEFSQKIIVPGNFQRWLNFKIVNNGGTLSTDPGLIYIISVYDVTFARHAYRSDTMVSWLNLLNENRRRNIRVKAMIDVHENEREELALELHEDLGTSLSHIKYGLQLISDMNAQAGFQDSEEVVRELTGLCQHSISKIRRIYGNLAPAGLKEFGLETIVRRIIDVDFKNSGIGTHLDSNLGGIRFHDFIELNYYRMARELMDNVLKFSQAANVYIVLKYEFNRLTLLVADDGVGFNPDKMYEANHKLVRKKVGNGLRNIQERCKILSCSFTIFASLNEGCRVTIEKEIRRLL